MQITGNSNCKTKLIIEMRSKKTVQKAEMSMDEFKIIKYIDVG